MEKRKITTIKRKETIQVKDYQNCQGISEEN